jgi:hypothetical protein
MSEISLEKIRQTNHNKTLGAIRIFIGVIIGSTGIMKLTVPVGGINYIHHAARLI